MNFSYPQIVLSEVPGEISLALSISGCPLRCKGCHSTETYDLKFGEKLNEHKLDKMIVDHISCVLFYGGEWNPSELIHFLKYVKMNGLKTCLYTGYELEFIHIDILKNLDFIKVGSYDKELGGLGSTTTNQRIISLVDGEEVINN